MKNVVCLALIATFWGGMPPSSSTMYESSSPVSLQVPDGSESRQLEATLFGHAVVNGGDQDGDGSDDLLVAAPLAWSEHGRTGRVLLLSQRTGAVIHSYAGEPNEWEFGSSLYAIRAARHAPAKQFAIGLTYGPPAGKETRPSKALGPIEAMRVISASDGGIVTLLEGVTEVCGTPGDFDRDGIADYLCRYRAARNFSKWESRWYSGNDWRMIQTPKLPGRIDLLDEDYDGDGLADVVTYGDTDHPSVCIISSRTGDSIRQLSGPISSPTLLGAATTAGRLVDGKRGIILCTPSSTSRQASHRMFSGVTGNQDSITQCDRNFSGLTDTCFSFNLFGLPDIDADGSPDFCEISTIEGDDSVRAYSGNSLKLLWRTPDVVSPNHHSLSTVEVQSPEEKAPQQLLVVGNVLDLRPYAEIGVAGEVVVLNSKGGTVVMRFLERDYPQISRKSYLDQVKKEKK